MKQTIENPTKDNVYFYIRKYGWEHPIIDYFQKNGYWDRVFVSKRFPEDESYYAEENIKHHIPASIMEGLYEYLPQFIDMQSRSSALSDSDYREYNYHDYLNLFSIYSDVYYNFFIENKISLLLMNRAPHLGFDLIVMLMARALDIRTIFLEQSHFPNRFFMYSDFYDFGKFETAKKCVAHHPFHIEKKHEKVLSYMWETPLSPKQKLKKIYGNNPLIRMLSQLTHKEHRGQAIYRYDLKKKFKKNYTAYNQNVDLNEKFVYFGLHLQPEQTTSAWGGKYVDQLLALERLSDFIPEDIKIYVKENPKQTYVMRGDLFYQRLRRIKKVVLVPNDTDTYELMKKALFVSTITGTMAWEAITGGKNALIFGWGAWYRHLPGIYYFDDQPRYQDLITKPIDHDRLEEKVNEMINKTGEGIIFPIKYYHDLVPNFNPEENTKSIIRSLKAFLYEA